MPFLYVGVGGMSELVKHTDPLRCRYLSHGPLQRYFVPARSGQNHQVARAKGIDSGRSAKEMGISIIATLETTPVWKRSGPS